MASGAPAEDVNRTTENPADDLNIYTVKSTAEIRSALGRLRDVELAVTSKLNKLVSSQRDLQRELGRLDLSRATLSAQGSKTRAISHGLLSEASVSAQRLSNSVKRLDLEQSRVQATLTVVEQVEDLKACVLGVVGSMGGAQDWETAAAYLNRASKIPLEVVNGPFAAKVVPTAEVPDMPGLTLNNASESLCGLFLREFDKAVKENDGARITRFFKLFPLINRSKVGLDVYGRYVCQGVASRARANLNAGTGGNQSKDELFFANALARLFEHIAQIIDGHGGLVARHYGEGSMNRVIERLQIEADLQGGIVLDTWSDERRIDRQLTDIRSYAYTFLVQSFLPASRGAAGTPRSNSPANVQGRRSEDEGVDMKQVDSLLNEMTLMLGKWSLYARFISDKCSVPGTNSVAGEIPMPPLLVNSSLMRKVLDRVINPFNIMTTFFFRRSVERAFQLDEQPPDLTLNPHKPLNSNPPHTTSAIDDIMYIMNKIVHQTLNTCQLSVVVSVIPSLARVMNSDFLGMVQRKMRDESYPRAAMQGSLPPEYLIVAFLVLLNNLDVAQDYVEQVLRGHIGQAHDAAPTQSLRALFPNDEEVTAVTSLLKSFKNTFSEKTSELLSEGIQVMFANVMKPRLRPLLLDAFRDTDYQVASDVEQAGFVDDEDEDASDLVRRRSQHGWDALTKPIGRLMTEHTFDQLLALVVVYVSKLLEKRMWTYQGRVTEQGAIRLERDVNAIIQVVVAGKKYSYREPFVKCSQICMIMNMDEEEWEAMQHGGDEIADKLTVEERTRARNLVRDNEL